MQPLGPYTLSATDPQPITVDWGSVSGNPPIGVDLKNISGLLCKLNIAGQSDWLLPWTARYFPVPANITSAEIIPQTDLTPTAADPLKLTATVYQSNDVAPYPNLDRSLTGLAAAAAIEGTVPVTVENTLTTTVTNDVSVTPTGTINVQGVVGGTAIGIAGTVQVASGTVNIGNTPVVQIAANQSIGISGTPNVTINGTPTVAFTAGSTVAISGTPTVAFAAGSTVTISGTPSVAISGTPTVNIATGQSIAISGTPSVAISGTPTVNIAAGQTIAITGTVTTSVSNTVTVSPSGTIDVQGVVGGTAIGVAGSVTIASGTVNIGNSPTVNIAANQSIAISGTPNVAITGTPTVAFAAGQSVSITAGTVDISNTVETEVNNFSVGSWAFPAVGGSGSSHSFTIPANAHSLKVFVTSSAAFTGSLSVVGNQSGFQYLLAYPLVINEMIAIPLGGSGVDTSVTFTVHNTTLAGTMFVMGSTDPSLVPVTTPSGSPLFVAEFHSPDQYSSSSVGSGGSTTFVAGAAGTVVRVFSAWVNAALLSGANAGGYITHTSTGNNLARAQCGVAGSATDSNTFGGNGLLLSVGAGDSIALHADAASIFVSGGMAYTFS